MGGFGWGPKVYVAKVYVLLLSLSFVQALTSLGNVARMVGTEVWARRCMWWRLGPSCDIAHSFPYHVKAARESKPPCMALSHTAVQCTSQQRSDANRFRHFRSLPSFSCFPHLSLTLSIFPLPSLFLLFLSISLSLSISAPFPLLFVFSISCSRSLFVFFSFDLRFCPSLIVNLQA